MDQTDFRLTLAAIFASCCFACGSRSALDDDQARDASPTDATAHVDAKPMIDSGHDAALDAPLVYGCFDAPETLLADHESSPTAIAIDATHVYWSNAGSDCTNGQIRAMPKAGGPIVTLADAQPNPRAIAVDDDRVYFYDGCGSALLRSVPKHGGPIHTYPISVDPSQDARVIALDADHIYFNAYGVLRIPKNGGAQSVIDAQDFVYALAADDAGVFWAGPIGGGLSYGVFSYHLGDTGPTLLVSPDSVGTDIAIDAQHVYFVGNGIERMPRNGGSVSTLVAASAYRLALDDGFVYWTEGVVGTGSAVKEVAKSGGAETVIATGTGAYLDLAVDERCVYWSDMYGGRIERAPK